VHAMCAYACIVFANLYIILSFFFYSPFSSPCTIDSTVQSWRFF